MKRKRAAAAAMIVLLAGMTGYGIHSLREWIETDQNEGKAILEEELDSSGGDGNTSSENGEPYANEAAEDGETEDQWEKGYDLPISDADRAEAESDCKAVMGSLSYIYQRAAAGVEAGSDVVLPDEILGQMKEVIGKTGVPVLTSESYSAMENYGQMDRFLKDCIEGQEGTAVLYEISSGGSVYGTFLDGENIYSLDLKTGTDTPVMVVMGNEADGISDAVAGTVPDRLYIPSYPQDERGSESLNVAVATAIATAEFRRRLL